MRSAIEIDITTLFAIFIGKQHKSPHLMAKFDNPFPFLKGGLNNGLNELLGLI
ncbi:Uncharacterised protein [Vibrio cholerae]|nr:Uncharacterised protein [Vibrio cholerae]